MLEIERKYVIEMPKEEVLLSFEGVSRSEITQTYLLSERGVSRRVRRRVFSDRHEYTLNEKKRISGMIAEESEREITREDYTALLRERDPARRTVEKCRYAFPYEGHIIEVDIYPFWQRTAILEVELSEESERALLPPVLKVLSDVSENEAYKNRSLSVSIPEE